MTKQTPFRKIFIANRGEIALRVIRTARSLGYRTVAAYSSADARAGHVLEADQAVWIGEALPSQSYLNIPALIEAARKIGADAVHPGYGFLAENADFARACRDAGLVFIGPSPEAILAMGNKAGAKRLMMDAGVPCVPGYEGEDQSDARLATEAERIGYPVMIKAAAGGGGRGLRLVVSAHEFPNQLHSAQSEAKNAFGDATVILERAIVEPRHIEIQVFADRHGSAIHLGERDCSVQRRHQKIIEEAPSPVVTQELREQMGATAIAAVKAIGYEGAGTLEFLLDQQGNFYFMEMNTRLQVEHPVTEAITGLDLVDLQLRVASGEPLPLHQQDVHFQGHAIEARLCVEDVDQSFMPQSGTIGLWHPTDRLRVEHALKSGTEIPPYYDSMIAKIISHGTTREEARRKLISGLEDSIALGVKTNQHFLARCIDHPVFARGDATTAFISQNLDDLLRKDESLDQHASALAAVLFLETSAGARQHGTDRRLSHPLSVGLLFQFNGRKHKATLTDLGANVHLVEVDHHRAQIKVVELGAHTVHFLCDGVVERAAYLRQGPRLLMLYRGASHELIDVTRAASARQESAGANDGKLRATMNGRVVAVSVTLGERVTAGQAVMTLEAMKMEHIHVAPFAGIVKEVHVATGDQLPAHSVVVEIEADPVAPK